VLAELYDHTRPTPARVPPDLDSLHRLSSLPLGLVVNVPANQPSSELDPGRIWWFASDPASTLLPAGGWIVSETGGVS